MGNARFIHESRDLLGCNVNVELLKRENRVVVWHLACSLRDPPKAGLGGKMANDNDPTR
jgi:hypothetical protein